MDLKKELGSVAEAVKKVMEAELSPKQKQIAKMAEPKHKIDAGDLAKLRAGHKPVKEEQEQIDELDLIDEEEFKSLSEEEQKNYVRLDEISDKTLKSYLRKRGSANKAAENAKPGQSAMDVYDKTDMMRKKARKRLQMRSGEIKSNQLGGKLWYVKPPKSYYKEEVEQIDEAGYSAKAARAGKDIGKPGKMFAKIASSAAKKYGSEERGKKVAGAVLKKLRMKEDVDFEITDEETEELLNAYEQAPKTFSEMMAAYKETGLSLFAEEPTEEQFNKEIKDQTDSATGKKKQPGVATPITVGTKTMDEETHTEVEVTDFNDVNGVKTYTIDLEEKTLTEPEAKKKEEVVKSMKKKMPSFKERYGERAKSVIYATATKIAKEKA